jgi:chromosome partitioning protein
LLVDLDTQGQVARSLGVTPEGGIAELMASEANLEDVLIEARPNLWLLAGGSGLAGVKRLIDRQDIAPERVLANALAPLDSQYDYSIVDTAPSWDVLNINALFYADEILAPVAIEPLCVHGLADFTKSVATIQRYRPYLVLRYVLPTLLDVRRKQTEEILPQLHDYFGEKVLDPIRINVRLSEAPGHGKTIFEYDDTCPGAQDYRRLVERVRQDG